MGQGADINLDSFLDIMTCLVGCLVLILILTSLDAGQIKVLIQTPMEQESAKNPVYIECRSNQMFYLDNVAMINKVQQALDDEARKVRQDNTGDKQTMKMIQALGSLKVENDYYRADLTYAMLDQVAFRLKPGVTGYALKDIGQEKGSDWYGQILTKMDPDTEVLSFLVRDDSYRVFKLARALAWNEKIEVTYQLLDLDDPLRFRLNAMTPIKPTASE